MQGYEIASNARLGAELQLDPSRGVSRFRLVQAAAAAAMEMKAARLERGNPAAEGRIGGATNDLVADERMADASWADGDGDSPLPLGADDDDAVS